MLIVYTCCRKDILGTLQNYLVPTHSKPFQTMPIAATTQYWQPPQQPTHQIKMLLPKVKILSLSASDGNKYVDCNGHICDTHLHAYDSW